MRLRYRLFGILLVAAGLISAFWIAPPKAAISELPSKISDRAFWKMIEEFSEPGGFFRSDNFISNESSYQQVIPELRKNVRPGGAYIGVGPDQNFTYIVALRPKIAFIVDIRRQNMLEHLLFKALFEISKDRTDFLSHLFSRPPPQRIEKSASIEEILDAFEEVASERGVFERNFQDVLERLAERHRFNLQPDDPKSIEYIYGAFVTGGPEIRYSFPSRWGRARFPTYRELVVELDAEGRNHNYLATEENFQFLKRLHSNNLVIPIVADFAGDKGLQAVAGYLKDHQLTISAFYTSNVEFYLFQGEGWMAFLSNVSTLPVDETSTFIRAYFNNYGYRHPDQRPGYRSVTLLDNMRSVLDAFDKGQIRTYYDLVARSR